MASLFRAYPTQSLLTLLALLFAGIAEGIGLSALLPLLNLAVQGGPGGDALSQQPGELEQTVNAALATLGFEPGIGVMLTVIVLGVTVKSVLLLFARRQVGYTSTRIATGLRLEMLRAILRSRWQYFLDRRIGKLANSLATEAQRSSEAFVNGATVITFLIQTVIYACVALAISWRATVLSVAAGVLIVAVSHILVRVARNAGKRQTGLLNSLLSRLTDTLQSVKPLKAMGREHLADSVLAMETRHLDGALRRQVVSVAVLSVAQEQMFAIVIALGMFIALVHFDMPVTVVMVLVMVLGRMLAQFGKAQRQYQRMAIGESAYWSMRIAIEEAGRAEEAQGGDVPPLFRHAVKLSSVYFSYSGQRILNGVDLELPAGTLTVLTGPSGAGKTTLVDVLIGLLKPQAGSVSIDGLPLDSLDMHAWRRMIGYVPQETLLLHDTVLHNVTLGDPSLSEADARQALFAADAWKFVAALPEGLHSMVGERGGRLSGGQRQRILIARALVGRPRLLILDEATASLDPGSEAALCATIKALRGELTILAISHQTALVDAADRVYRLNAGAVQLVEHGARARAAAGA